MKKIMQFFILIVFIFIFTFGAKYDYPDIAINLEIIISFFSIILVMGDTSAKYFKYLWMRFLFILTVIIQSMTTCFLYFFQNQIIENLNTFSTIMIIIELSFYIVYRMIIENIWNDIKLLETRIKFKIRNVGKNKNTDFNKINSAVEELNTFIKKKQNKAISNSDLKIFMNIFMDVICKSEQLIIINQFHDIQIMSENTIIKLLKKMNIRMRKNEAMFNQFIAVYFKILDITSRLKSDDLINDYLDLLNYFLKKEIRFNKSENVVSIMINYYSFLEKLDNENNYLSKMIDNLDKLFIIFQAHNYKMNTQEIHVIVAGYISVLKTKSNYINNIFTIDRLKIVIGIINNYSDNKDNIFENIMIQDIYSTPNKLEDRLKLIANIYNIYHYNNFELKRIIYTMCDYLVTTFKEDLLSKEEKLTIFKILMEIAQSLTNEDIIIVSMEDILGFINKNGINDEVSQEMLQYLSVRHTKNDYLFNLTIYTLNNNLSEDNFDEYIDIFKTISERLYSHNLKEIYINTINLIDKMFNVGTKKYLTHIDDFKENTKFLLKKLEDIIENSDDFVIKEITMATYDDLLKNTLIEEQVFDYIYYIGIKAIEFLDVDLVHNVSNYIGWYLYKLIEKFDTQLNETKLIVLFDKITKFYQLTCDYINDMKASGVFVGTIFVVNLVYIQIKMDQCKNQDKLNMYKSLKLKLKIRLRKLSDNQKEILKKSFRIRKETLDIYIPDYDNLKEISIKVSKEFIN